MLSRGVWGFVLYVGALCHIPVPPSLQCEAVQFDMSWKVPAILYYARRNLNSKYNLVSECLSRSGCLGASCLLPAHPLSPFPAVKNPIEASVLLAEASLARKQRKCHATFIPLMLSEMPQAGDLVGLDAEFVTLNEVRQWGTGCCGCARSHGAAGAVCP